MTKRVATKMMKDLLASTEEASLAWAASGSEEENAPCIEYDYVYWIVISETLSPAVL